MRVKFAQWREGRPQTKFVRPSVSAIDMPVYYKLRHAKQTLNG